MGIGISSASAAVIVEPTALPVYATMSPVNSVTYADEDTNVAGVTKNFSWGGGIGRTYNVTYYDGKKDVIIDRYANYTYTSYPEEYNIGSLTQRTWNTVLRVSNGSSETVYGTVKVLKP